jgi:hypothetical protein
VRGRARAAAVRTLATNVEAFERAGYRIVGRGDFERRLERRGAVPLRLRMVPEGRVFGGSFALEVATADPVLPPTRGLSARGRGAIRLQRVAFRPRGGDPEGARLAARLEADEALQRALAAVHFERVHVEPEGRAVVRHLGGSVVWLLVPPFVRPVPLPPEQVGALVAALGAFARSR